MSIAIKWGSERQAGDSLTADMPEDNSSGFIYFDAVTAYTKNKRGNVTKHPISSGSNISDHFIVENPSITLSGVISSSDISPFSFFINDEDFVSPSNVRQSPTPVNIKSTDDSLLDKFVPDVIGQFFGNTEPDIVVADKRTSNLKGIEDSLSRLVYNKKVGQIDVDNRIILVKLYEYESVTIARVIDNLVVTSFTVKETPDGGDALYFDMTFEQVTFAYLKKSSIPKNITPSLKKKASAPVAKGKQDSTVQDATNPSGSTESVPKDTDPLRQAKEE